MSVNRGRVIPTPFQRDDGSIDVSLEFEVVGLNPSWHRENTKADSGRLAEICAAFGVPSPDWLSSTWRDVEVDEVGKMVLPVPPVGGPPVEMPAPISTEPELPLESEG